MTPNDEATYTVEEFARLMNIHPATVGRWIKLRIVPGAHQDARAHWLIPHSALKMKRPKQGRPFGPIGSAKSVGYRKLREELERTRKEYDELKLKYDELLASK